MEIGEGYLDEKFAELRRAVLAGVAATLYLAYLKTEGQGLLLADVAVARIEELKAQAAKDAVDLYYRV